MSERACPECGKAMVAETVHATTVDICEEHGIWLDNGELEGIVMRLKNKSVRSRRRQVAKAKSTGRTQGWLFGPMSFLFD